jgi:hypothetical protein
MPAGRVVAPSVTEILRSHETRITTEAERFLADPAAWIYVNSGAPAPDFQNGFFNVLGSRVPLRYRFLRPWDPSTTENAIQMQGSVGGGAAGLVIFTLLYPQVMPDGSAAWVTATRDYDVHLTACDDAGDLKIISVLTTGDVVYGFV